MRIDIDGHIMWQPRSVYFLFVCASPTGYTTGYLQGRTRICSRRCHLLICYYVHVVTELDFIPTVLIAGGRRYCGSGFMPVVLEASGIYH